LFGEVISLHDIAHVLIVASHRHAVSFEQEPLSMYRVPHWLLQTPLIHWHRPAVAHAELSV
jgi:hypothetical protein